jgi:hypothetical protein
LQHSKVSDGKSSDLTRTFLVPDEIMPKTASGFICFIGGGGGGYDTSSIFLSLLLLSSSSSSIAKIMSYFLCIMQDFVFS